MTLKRIKRINEIVVPISGDCYLPVEIKGVGSVNTGKIIILHLTLTSGPKISVIRTLLSIIDFSFHSFK